MLIKENVETEQLIAAVTVPRGLVGVGGHVPVRRSHGTEHNVFDRPLHLRYVNGVICAGFHAGFCIPTKYLAVLLLRTVGGTTFSSVTLYVGGCRHSFLTVKGGRRAFR